MNTITISVGPLGLQWPITIGPPLSPETVVIQPAFSPLSGMVTVVTVTPSSPTVTEDSNGDQGTITVMVSPTSKPTPITIVLASATTTTGTTTMQGGLATTFTSLIVQIDRIYYDYRYDGNAGKHTGLRRISAYQRCCFRNDSQTVIHPSSSDAPFDVSLGLIASLF
ncbi:hypothetical protein EIP86_002983 [Pleurotus ostreatoroseus]|nr:hypothetical protein EIP86_002983 [Pleurotus ostreatoroseus]